MVVYTKVMVEIREKWMNSRDTYEVKLLDLNDRLNLWGMRKISKIILKL